MQDALISEFLKKDKAGKRLKVAVFGDCGLDQYYYTQVNRISPEFPIPVSLSLTEEPDHTLPGMAANVVYQFRNFNVDAFLVSIINQKAQEIYSKCGVDARYCACCAYQIPTKKRFYHNDFPLSRWDVEDFGNCPLKISYANIEDRFMDLLVFSDYNKGFFDNQVQSLISRVTVPTIVDPKSEDIDKWKNCTIFKPNSFEAKKLSNLSDWREQALYFQERLKCQAVVITRGGDGVVGLIEGKEFQYNPKNLDTVNSVIGAGDCFIAFMAMAIGRGFEVKEAVEIAYEAGAIYVQNKHNEPVTPHLLLAYEDPIAAKIRQPEELKDRNCKLVFTNGCFDAGLTSGHVKCLQFAKKQGDKLVVAVNSDDSVRRLKGSGRPFMPLSERMEVIAALDCVDYVVSFDKNDPLEVIKIILPNVIVKGGDYRPEQVVGFGISEIIISPHFECLSTTEKLALFSEYTKTKGCGSSNEQQPPINTNCV